MPWSDHSDQGPKSGPKPGPWGAPPSGGGRGGDDGGEPPRPPRGPGGPRRPAPPSGEDLNVRLHRLRQRLNDVFGAPGGGVPPRLIAAIVAVCGVIWFSSGIYLVGQSEQAVITTFGRYTRTTGPGPHWRLVPFEQVEKVSVTALKRVDIGGTPSAEAPNESLMLTGDENIVDLAFTVQYRVNDAYKFVFNVKDPDDELVKAIAESAVREVVGKTGLQAILTNGRGRLQNETADLMQHILDNYNSGITVVEVQVRSANPPADVIPDFQAVASAGQYADSAVNEATAYSNKVVNEAKGDAAKITQAAEGYRSQTVLEAEGDAARFNQVYDQYRRAPAVTRQRLYLETMERVLGKSNKVIVDAKGASAPIILPPDAFRPKSAQQPPAPPPTQGDPSQAQAQARSGGAQ